MNIAAVSFRPQKWGERLSQQSWWNPLSDGPNETVRQPLYCRYVPSLRAGVMTAAIKQGKTKPAGRGRWSRQAALKQLNTTRKDLQVFAFGCLSLEQLSCCTSCKVSTSCRTERAVLFLLEKLCRIPSHSQLRRLLQHRHGTRWMGKVVQERVIVTRNILQDWKKPIAQNILLKLIKLKREDWEYDTHGKSHTALNTLRKIVCGQHRPF